MTAPIIAFFNNKGRVGKTSLVYHIAWMFCDFGLRVVAADLDPQANLTAAFLDPERLEEIWENSNSTIYQCVQPLVRGFGDITDPNLEEIDSRLVLLVGDLALSGFEDELSTEWSKCMDGKERSFRVISAFWRLLDSAASSHEAEVVLMDLGPNLGAINRAALIAADYVVIPLAPDLFSLQGLRNLGPTLHRWRKEWQERLGKNPERTLDLPLGKMKPIGYVILQHAVRYDRPVQDFQRRMDQIPGVYQEKVLAQSDLLEQDTIQEDSNCLAMLKNYQSLMPLAQEARKPMFHLKYADGAIGARTKAVQRVYDDFKGLSKAIAKSAGVTIPERMGVQPS